MVKKWECRLSKRILNWIFFYIIYISCWIRCYLFRFQKSFLPLQFHLCLIKTIQINATLIFISAWPWIIILLFANYYLPNTFTKFGTFSLTFRYFKSMILILLWWWKYLWTIWWCYNYIRSIIPWVLNLKL